LNLQSLPRLAIISCFVVLSATSTIYILASTVNYLGFYTALNQITTSVSRITFASQNTSKGGSLLSTVIVNNPSDYSGFKVADLTLATYLVPSNTTNDTLFQGSPLEASAIHFNPLPPHAQISLNLTTILDSTEASSLSYYLTVNSDKVTAHSILYVSISTFLDSAVGYFSPNPTGTTQDTPLSLGYIG